MRNGSGNLLSSSQRESEIPRELIKILFTYRSDMSAKNSAPGECMRACLAFLHNLPLFATCFLTLAATAAADDESDDENESDATYHQSNDQTLRLCVCKHFQRWQLLFA